MKLLLSEVLFTFARAVLLRGEEVVGVHLSTIPRLSATGSSSSLSASFLQTWMFFSVPGGAVCAVLSLLCVDLQRVPGENPRAKRSEMGSFTKH